jgi:hypothetical protein
VNSIRVRASASPVNLLTESHNPKFTKRILCFYVSATSAVVLHYARAVREVGPGPVAAVSAMIKAVDRCGECGAALWACYKLFAIPTQAASVMFGKINVAAFGFQSPLPYATAR